MQLCSETQAPPREFDGDLGPTVTIAIPTFNRAALLRNCVASALSQNYPRLEILISDNASTDDTQDVLREFDDDRLRVIRQPTNIGLLPNWNSCVAAARGEYLIVVSDDDIISPRLVERCIGVLDGMSDDDRRSIPIVVALSELHAAATGRRNPAKRSRRLSTGICDGKEILQEYLADRIGVLATCSVMMRTDALRAVGGYPLDLPHTADIGAWAPLLLMGKAGFVNEAHATWFSHGQSETARLGIDQLLRDGWKVADLISTLAVQHAGSELGRSLRRQSRRCFAGRGVTILSDCRRNGGDPRTLLAFVWRFRRDFFALDARSAFKLIAAICFPRLVTEQARRFKQVMTNFAV